MKKEFALALYEEVSNKKVFTADYDGRCNVGGDTLYIDDEFVFIGDRKKCCMNCQAEIITALEGYL